MNRAQLKNIITAIINLVKEITKEQDLSAAERAALIEQLVRMRLENDSIEVEVEG